MTTKVAYVEITDSEDSQEVSQDEQAPQAQDVPQVPQAQDVPKIDPMYLQPNEEAQEPQKKQQRKPKNKAEAKELEKVAAMDEEQKKKYYQEIDEANREQLIYLLTGLVSRSVCNDDAMKRIANRIIELSQWKREITGLTKTVTMRDLLKLKELHSVYGNKWGLAAKHLPPKFRPLEWARIYHEVFEN